MLTYLALLIFDCFLPHCRGLCNIRYAQAACPIDGRIWISMASLYICHTHKYLLIQTFSIHKRLWNLFSFSLCLRRISRYVSTFPIMMREWFGSFFFQHNAWVCRVVFQEKGTAFRPPPLILYAPNHTQFYEFWRYFREEKLILKRTFGAALLLILTNILFLSMFSIVFIFYVY